MSFIGGFICGAFVYFAVGAIIVAKKYRAAKKVSTNIKDKDNDSK